MASSKMFVKLIPSADESSKHVPVGEFPPLCVTLELVADGIVQSTDVIVESLAPVFNVEMADFRHHRNAESVERMTYCSEEALCHTYNIGARY